MKKIARYILSPSSIYSKLFLLFFSIGVLPLIIGSIYVYYKTHDAILQTAHKEMEIKATTGMRNIVTMFVESGNSLELAAQNTAFTRYSENPDEQDMYLKTQENSLLQLSSHYSGLIESAGFADKEGKVVTSILRGDLIPSGIDKKDLSDHSFFKEALNLSHGIVYHGLPEFSESSGKWVIPNAAAVFNRQGVVSGILFLQIYLDSISQLISGLAYGEDIIFVLNNKGEMIASSRAGMGTYLSPAYQPEDHLSYRRVIQKMTSGEDGSAWIYYKGKSYYILYKNIPGDAASTNNWSIGIMTPAAAIYSGFSINRYLLFILTASLIIFALAVFIGWRLARPIQELTVSSIAMSKGKLTSRVNIRRKDEIGQLALAFNEMATSIQSSHEELLRLSTIDGLTGLHNHREFQKRLEEEVNRASRYGTFLSLLMIDIDKFKRFNDTYGHQTGDIVLRSISLQILHKIRGSDLAARYGGEEMAIILPETVFPEAYALSERIRKDIEDIPVTVMGNKTIHVTVSIGIASFPEDASDKEGLIEAADQALYFAKEDGRNKTIRYGDALKSMIGHNPSRAAKLLNQAEEWIFRDLRASVEAHFPFFRGHFEAVSRTALQVADILHLKEDEIKDLRIASMLYEIGTLDIPPDILLKQGPLTRDEWSLVKTHPETGVNILNNVFKLQNILPAILHHHERYDGTGYPSGLKGENIPLLSRIISVIDAYYAMTTVVSYRKRLSEEEAIVELRRHSGTQFDPRIVEAFLDILNRNKHGAPRSEGKTPLGGERA